MERKNARRPIGVTPRLPDRPRRPCSRASRRSARCWITRTDPGERPVSSATSSALNPPSTRRRITSACGAGRRLIRATAAATSSPSSGSTAGRSSSNAPGGRRTTDRCHHRRRWSRARRRAVVSTHRRNASASPRNAPAPATTSTHTCEATSSATLRPTTAPRYLTTSPCTDAYASATRASTDAPPSDAHRVSSGSPICGSPCCLSRLHPRPRPKGTCSRGACRIPEPGGPPWGRPSRPEPARLPTDHFGGGGTRQVWRRAAAGEHDLEVAGARDVHEDCAGLPVVLPIFCSLGVLPGSLRVLDGRAAGDTGRTSVPEPRSITITSPPLGVADLVEAVGVLAALGVRPRRCEAGGRDRLCRAGSRTPRTGRRTGRLTPSARCCRRRPPCSRRRRHSPRRRSSGTPPPRRSS